MKNYYEILQVDKNASPEIIKVAYKLLVKKNHPDLKEGAEKKEAEERIKEINEAYEVLSDTFKKTEYDATLVNDTISQEQYNSVINENIILKKELNYFHNLHRTYYEQRPYSNMYDNNRVNNNIYNPNIKKNVVNHTKKTNEKLTEKQKSIIAVILTFLILFIMYQIPFIQDFVNLYLSSGYIFFFLAIVIFYLYFYKNKH